MGIMDMMENNIRLQMIGDKVFINNTLVKSPPNYCKKHKAVIINGIIYLDGFQWKENTWKLTLKSIYYYLFS